MSPDHVVLLLEQYKYLLLFPLAVLEGPIITIVAGLLVSKGIFNGIAVYIIVVLGDLVGDTFWYAVGRFGHGASSAWIERVFGMTQEKLERARQMIEKQRFRMTAFAKLSYGIGFAGLVAAGMVRVPYLLFVAACLLVTLGQVAFFMLVGIFFGHAYTQIEAYLNYFAASTIIVGACIVVFLLWHFWWRKRKLK